MIKKLLYLLGAVALVVGLTACDPNDPSTAPEPNAGIVINKKVNHYEWGSYYYLAILHPDGSGDASWVGPVSARTFNSCFTYPSTKKYWYRYIEECRYEVY